MHPEQMRLKQERAEWIFSAGIPYSIVEDDQFKFFIDDLNPRLRFCENHLRIALMPKIYEQVNHCTIF